MNAFETDDGVRVPAVTAEEMREIDRMAVEEAGLGLLQMMENAGRNLAVTARETRTDGPVVVLAGSGGNGGGGLCCARHLANHGVPVEAVLDRDAEELDGAARGQFETLATMDVPVKTDDVASVLDDAGLVVDALVGYGLRDTPCGRVRELIVACEDHASRVLALDVPSGVNATTGRTPGVAVVADCTIALALPKTGLADVSGDLVLADVGIPATAYDRVGLGYEQPFDGRYRVPIRESDA